MVVARRLKAFVRIRRISHLNLLGVAKVLSLYAQKDFWDHILLGVPFLNPGLAVCMLLTSTALKLNAPSAMALSQTCAELHHQ